MNANIECTQLIRLKRQWRTQEQTQIQKKKDNDLIQKLGQVLCKPTPIISLSFSLSLFLSLYLPLSVKSPVLRIDRLKSERERRESERERKEKRRERCVCFCGVSECMCVCVYVIVLMCQTCVRSATIFRCPHQAPPRFDGRWRTQLYMRRMWGQKNISTQKNGRGRTLKLDCRNNPETPSHCLNIQHMHPHTHHANIHSYTHTYILLALLRPLHACEGTHIEQKYMCAFVVCVFVCVLPKTGRQQAHLLACPRWF